MPGVARPASGTTTANWWVLLAGKMAVGVVLQDSEIDLAASFYIPCESLAQNRLRLGLALASSHVWFDIDRERPLCLQVERKLRQWRQLVGENVLFIVPLDADAAGGEFVFPGDNLVLLVPVVDSIVYWNKLRQLSQRYRLILDLKNPVLKDILTRYKCLHYDAVVATCNTIGDVGHLLAKRHQPHLMVHQAEIGRVLMLAFVSVSHPSVLPHSDELIDPLQPLTRDLGLEVYQTFEEDKVKYSQYDGAIEMAIDDLRHLTPFLKVLVIGPGRGPLLEMVMGYTSDEDTVVAIERNANCIDLLKTRTEHRKLITVIHDDVRNLPTLEYDIIVSELLGSFGCNEACPEILQQFTSPQTIMIPQLYTSFVQPSYCDILDKFHAKRPYVASLNSVYHLGPPVPIFEFLHPENTKLNQRGSLKVDLSPINPCNVVIGYFEAQLYGPFRIGITPRVNSHEFCSSWYPMVFPVGLLDIPATILFFRKSTKTALWYQWKVNDAWFNLDASDYMIDLYNQ